MAITTIHPLYQNERGAALVISLMFLVIMGLLGTTAMVMTTTDMKIGTNYRQNAQTFYNADGGVQYVIATIENDLKNGTTVANGTTNVLPTTVGNSEPFTASPTGFNLTISNITMISRSPDIYSFTCASQNSNDRSKTEIDVQFRKDLFDPAFGVGILSDGNITIHGTTSIAGGMHANGSVTQTGGGTVAGDVSAVGSTSVGAAVSGNETPNADTINVPLITAADFNAWRMEAQTAPNIYSAGNYTYSDTGDQAKKIVFADGNISVSGSDLKNVTIIATGNIQVTGSSSMNTDGGIGTAMIAGGNITFNGSSHTYGAFWCNGNFVTNGSSMLEGSIVAGGDVTRNGTFNFTYNNKLENEDLPPGKECEIVTWKDSNS